MVSKGSITQSQYNAEIARRSSEKAAEKVPDQAQSGQTKSDDSDMDLIQDSNS
jgi:hypothetical protein